MKSPVTDQRYLITDQYRDSSKLDAYTEELSQAELAAIRQDLEMRLQQKGFIFIRKDSVLFEAVK